MTGVAKNTVVKLLVELAGVCQAYADENLRNLPCKRLQVDEIWAFCYSKQKNVPTAKQGIFGYGDVWTFVAIDADTKLVPSWLVGSRDIGSATEVMQDLVGRLANVCSSPRTAEGVRLGGRDAFGGSVDFAQLVKLYGNAPTVPRRATPRRIASERRSMPSSGAPMPSTSARPTSSARTSRCGCPSVASPG